MKSSLQNSIQHHFQTVTPASSIWIGCDQRKSIVYHKILFPSSRHVSLRACLHPQREVKLEPKTVFQKKKKQTNLPLPQQHTHNIKMESIRKLSDFNCQWTKTLYQNILSHITFVFTLFKGYRCNQLSVITPKTISNRSPRK